MIAILGWVDDGFSTDINVKGIYPTLAEATKYAKEGDKWVEFDFGRVDFDIHTANSFPSKPKKRKKPLDKRLTI